MIHPALNATTPVLRGTKIFASTVLVGPTVLMLSPNGNGDLLTANVDATVPAGTDPAVPNGFAPDPLRPSEIVEFTSPTTTIVSGATSGVFVKRFNVDPAAGGSFGLGSGTHNGALRFGYVDDNAAAATVLSTPGSGAATEERQAANDRRG